MAHGSTTTGWLIDSANGQAEDIEVDPLSEHGFEVSLQLTSEFQYIAASTYIEQAMREYLLFCPYRVEIAGAELALPSRAAWRRTIMDPRSRDWLVEDVQQSFGWSEPPLAVMPTDDGVLAIAPADEQFAPPSKVYRHGVFVLETEIIPQPLNFLFCGIFNVDDLNIRPDRKSFLEDSKFAAFERRVISAIDDTFRKIEESPSNAIEFFKGWLDPMIAGVIEHDELADLRPRMPLNVVTGRGIELSLDTTWSKLERMIKADRILFTKDPVADRSMIDFFRGGEDIILALHNAREHRLASACAHHAGVRLVELSDCYLEAQKRQAVPNPRLQALFAQVPSTKAYEIVFVNDSDARVPVRLMREEDAIGALKAFLSMLVDVSGEELPAGLAAGLEEPAFAIVNLSHPAVEVLEAGIESGASQKKLLNCAEVLMLTARMAEADEVKPEEHISLAKSLGELMSDALSVKRKWNWLRS